MLMKKMLNERSQMLNFVSSSGSGTVNNYGSGSDFLTSYGSGSTCLVTGADQEPPLKILPGLEKYEPPERSKVPTVLTYRYLKVDSQWPK
jgi:hypothetical protein